MLLRNKFRGSGLVTTLILVPMMLSPIVVATFWKLILNPSYGIFNYLLGYTNINTAPEWLGQPDLALWAIVIVDVWMWSPFVMLLCLAGLSAIPEYLYEAAAIDRASPWFQFRRITLPQVMPLLLIAVLFRTIEAFKQFDLVMGLTGGGPGDVTETVSVQLYQLAFQGQFDTGKSSALAYIVLVIIIAVSNLYIRALNRVREG
jgi:multiple sugar transport system permease protein